jgi:hypothetical protein
MMYVCVYIYTHTQICMYVCTFALGNNSESNNSVCVCVYIYTHTHICMYVCTFVFDNNSECNTSKAENIPPTHRA